MGTDFTRLIERTIKKHSMKKNFSKEFGKDRKFGVCLNDEKGAFLISFGLLSVILYFRLF